MKTELLDEVIACMPKGKTHYHYFKGAYASRLLSMMLPEKMSVKQLKQSRFKGLLAHQSIKPIVAKSGNGVLNRNEFDYVWQQTSKPFLLSLSRWGDNTHSWHNQVSRPGENLVLQLNLPYEHIRHYRQWMGANDQQTLNGEWSGHPVQKLTGNPLFRETLAWARIDIDFETNEALIEEIQSDSVRFVKRWTKDYKKCGCKKCISKLKYVDWFQDYDKIWSEAVLMATIWFIKSELGINRIFMHTARSGWQIKKMDKDWTAPRSLYSDLPKRFAFKQTWAAPDFLVATKHYQRLIRKQPDIDFYQLTMNELREAS